MKRSELDEILRLHKLYLAGKSEGIRANLSKANLRRANLIRADLSKADLRGADLSRADLIRADLSRVNLSKADLFGADLREANLREADLRGANLYGANLSDCKGVTSFTSGKHLAFYTPHNNYLKIGCEGHDLDYWIANYETIAKSDNWSAKDIKTYSVLIRAMRNL